MKDKKILVVDDDKDSVHLAELFLDGMWISKENIVVARDWIEAVEKVKAELFDVVIMDIKMPRMNGIQATQEIKAHHNWNSPKFVAYTADIQHAKYQWIEEMHWVMLKPVLKENFQKAILDALVAKALDKTSLDEINVGD